MPIPTVPINPAMVPMAKCFLKFSITADYSRGPYFVVKRWNDYKFRPVIVNLFRSVQENQSVILTCTPQKLELS